MLSIATRWSGYRLKQSERGLSWLFYIIIAAVQSSKSRAHWRAATISSQPKRLKVTTSLSKITSFIRLMCWMKYKRTIPNSQLFPLWQKRVYHIQKLADREFETSTKQPSRSFSSNDLWANDAATCNKRFYRVIDKVVLLGRISSQLVKLDYVVHQSLSPNLLSVKSPSFGRLKLGEKRETWVLWNRHSQVHI